MRRFGLAAAIFLATFAAASAKGPFDPFRVGNWNVGAFTNDKSGEFSHCAASVRYQGNGGTLFVWFNKDFSWSIGAERASLQFPLNSNIPIQISFDAIGPYSVNGWIREKNFFIARMPGDPNVIEAFKGAYYLFVRTPQETFRYALTSTSDLMPSLADCVRNHANFSVEAARPAEPVAPTPAPPVNSEAEAARNKLIKDLSAKYDKCVYDNMRGIVPYSNEGAETIAEVIITKCEDIQRQFVDLTTALYGVSRSNAAGAVSESVEKRRKAIVADIVTFRAELTRTLMNRPKKPEPEPSPKPQGQGL